MSEQCVNCDRKITSGTIMWDPNAYLENDDVRLVNFALNAEYVALCERCGTDLRREAYDTLRSERDRVRKLIEEKVPNFPMMTVGTLPGSVSYRIFGMVTANVTVGTGLFNEFSQGFSDLFGKVNSESGMAHKVNQGEGAARGILVHKAIQMGANCIIGVDVDYGVTNNNAATINMQGTAVSVPDLASVLTSDGCEAFDRIVHAWRGLGDIDRWIDGRMKPGEVFTPYEPE